MILPTVQHPALGHGAELAAPTARSRSTVRGERRRRRGRAAPRSRARSGRRRAAARRTRRASRWRPRPRRPARPPAVRPGRRWASTSARSSVAAARLQQREPGRRPAGHPGVRDHVTRPGARAQHRRAPGEVPVRGDGDDDGRPAGQVSPDDAHPERRALGGQPARQALDPRHGQVARDHQGDDRLVGRAPIAATSARFCTAARRPTSSPEDHARRKCRSSTSTSVVTTNRAVRCGHDGGVVAGRRASVSAPGGQEREDAGEERVLGQLGDERGRRTVRGCRRSPGHGRGSARPHGLPVTRCPGSDRRLLLIGPGRRRRGPAGRLRGRGARRGGPERDRPGVRERRPGDAGLARRRAAAAGHDRPGDDRVGRPGGPGRPAVRRRAARADDGALPDRRDPGRRQRRLGRRRERRRRWTFTTYGREPAVELHVPAAVAAERSTAFVDQLGPAVALTEQVRSCV